MATASLGRQSGLGVVVSGTPQSTMSTGYKSGVPILSMVADWSDLPLRTSTVDHQLSTSEQRLKSEMQSELNQSADAKPVRMRMTTSGTHAPKTPVCAMASALHSRFTSTDVCAERLATKPSDDSAVLDPAWIERELMEALDEFDAPLHSSVRVSAPGRVNLADSGADSTQATYDNVIDIDSLTCAAYNLILPEVMQQLRETAEPDTDGAHLRLKLRTPAAEGAEEASERKSKMFKVATASCTPSAAVYSMKRTGKNNSLVNANIACGTCAGAHFGALPFAWGGNKRNVTYVDQNAVFDGGGAHHIMPCLEPIISQLHTHMWMRNDARGGSGGDMGGRGYRLGGAYAHMCSTDARSQMMCRMHCGPSGCFSQEVHAVTSGGVQRSGATTD
jgi:hypothetical protein